MKRLFLIFTLATFTMSCSSDDDVADFPESQTQTEILVNGSPWTFNHAEVESVQRNDLNLTNEELKNLSENAVAPEFIFNSNGTVLLSANGNEFTAEFALINSNMKLIAPDGSEFELKSVTINQSEFSYEQVFEQVGQNTSEFTIWTSRLFYN